MRLIQKDGILKHFILLVFRTRLSITWLARVYRIWCIFPLFQCQIFCKCMRLQLAKSSTPQVPLFLNHGSVPCYASRWAEDSSPRSA
jgi:hypothetical protein